MFGNKTPTATTIIAIVISSAYSLKVKLSGVYFIRFSRHRRFFLLFELRKCRHTSNIVKKLINDKKNCLRNIDWNIVCLNQYRNVNMRLITSDRDTCFVTSTVSRDANKSPARQTKFWNPSQLRDTAGSCHLHRIWFRLWLVGLNRQFSHAVRNITANMCNPCIKYRRPYRAISQVARGRNITLRISLTGGNGVVLKL